MATEFKRTLKSPEEIESAKKEREKKAQEIERAKEEREARSREVNASWKKIKKEAAVEALVEFLKVRREMVLQVAVQGVGVNAKTGEEERLTSESRISQMDRVAGIDDALDYIQRHL